MLDPNRLRGARIEPRHTCRSGHPHPEGVHASTAADKANVVTNLSKYLTFRRCVAIATFELARPSSED
jgi:hypothetical protein